MRSGKSLVAMVAVAAAMAPAIELGSALESAPADGSAWRGLVPCRRSGEVVTRMKEIEA